MQLPFWRVSPGFHGLVLLVAPLLAVQAEQSSGSLKDTVGSELISRVDVKSDSLGDLGPISADVDAPEELELSMAAPKQKALTPAELALVQTKSGHKEMKEVSSHRQKTTQKHSLRKPKLVPVVAEGPQTVEDVSQASLEKQWETSNKQQAKANDADVDQLGGQLQNIMSELKDDKDQGSEKKKVQEQAASSDDSASEGSSDSSDDSEQEAALKPQKDDAENVVDGAMAYIRTRLAAEEHKSLRLRQLLQQSVRGNKIMREKVTQLQNQLKESAALQRSLRTVASKKLAQEEATIANETKRADTLTKQLQNATFAAKIGAKGLKVLGARLKYSKSQVAALLLNLANASQLNKDMHRRLESSNATAKAEASQIVADRKKISAQQKELEELKAKFAKLEKAKKAEDKVVKTLDRQKDLLEHKQASTVKRDKILHKENSMLKKQLATEVQREEQLREMWSKESEAFTWQLRAERANASESLSDLEKARSEFRDLRERVRNLREKATHGEKARHQAEDAVNRAQFALTEAEAENKQLKGSVPWLEAEVDRQRQSAANATKIAQQAMRERDNVKGILSQAQKNIVQLQGQYADALQALVVAQAGGGDPTKQQAPAKTINQFADQGSDLLGAPPPVSSPLIPSDGTSLLELGRDSKALDGLMPAKQATQPAGKVDLSKDSGGLNALLRGMNNNAR